MNFNLVKAPLNKIMPSVTRKASRAKLKLRKNSPHILFGVGIAGSVTSTVLACRATLRLHSTMDEIELDVANVKEARSVLAEENREPGEYDFYSIKDLNRDAFLVYVKAAAKLGRLYAPAIGVGVLSIGALSGAHVTLNRRNASLTAAYAAVQKAFDEYRDRMIAELGPERENDIQSDVVKYTGEDGEEVVVSRKGMSPYAQPFDSHCADWQKNPELNRMFIMCVLQWANDYLHAHGHLFLNDVYKGLGMPITPAGQVVGWVIGGNGEDYVDFGLDKPINEKFMQGLERTPWLDFNVHGVIYDQI